MATLGTKLLVATKASEARVEINTQHVGTIKQLYKTNPPLIVGQKPG